MPGCIVVLGFVLYPYVYLPTRALFALQSASLIETARTLGLTPHRDVSCASRCLLRDRRSPLASAWR